MASLQRLSEDRQIALESERLAFACEKVAVPALAMPTAT